MENIVAKLKFANTVKRIPVPTNFEVLKQQASALVQNKPTKITYVDGDGDNVEVMDNSDLKLALQNRTTITFLVSLLDSQTPVVEEMIDTSAKVVQPEETKVGKQGKKPAGGKGMNRKALKNLIQQEL
jgi:hypothetical protein